MQSFLSPTHLLAQVNDVAARAADQAPVPAPGQAGPASPPPAPAVSIIELTQHPPLVIPVALKTLFLQIATAMPGAW